MANRDLTPWRQPSMGLARDPFSAFRREMDRLFEDFFAPSEARSFEPAPQKAGVWPTIEVEETEQGYTVTAELAGVDQKDIDISLHDNALTLRGEKRSERKEENGGRRYSERSFGRFERTIPFESEVDADHVEAACENGVLRITLPTNPKARDRTRRIEIGGSAGGRSASAPGVSGDVEPPAPSLGGGAPGQSPPPVAGA